ncbi:MAG: putative 2-aminoethylphosphonate ABC transporter permease subunit [Alphaproteobacteria bacterium]|nr:putative 2-aminoethylphosphonate ABC transporter permease subunit [Alphaproteobacteria bacterium]
MSAAAAPAGGRRWARPSLDAVVMGGGVVLLGAALVLGIALPLGYLLAKSFQNQDGQFIGLANYIRYVTTPALFLSAWNSVWVAAVATLIVIPLAFVYAYALTRSCMPFKGLFTAIALVPILAPSLLPAISLIYLFGNQGMLKGAFGGQPIYGPIGIVIAQVFYCFPHALMILVTALATADGRLYEAATALRASRTRIFFTVTLPGVRYGLISAIFVVFTLVVTDFGIAKVIGGQFNVLATDVYKQVVGQQNFQMGAVVGMVLLIPAVLAFVADRHAQRRQSAALSARAVPLVPQPEAGFDRAMLAFCAAVAALLVGIVAVAAWGSLIRYWPYNLSLTLANYDFERFDARGWETYRNSLVMATGAATLGTAVVFVGAYFLERTPGLGLLRAAVRLIAMLPLAVPGLVLGLGYIFFFNAKANPLNVIYATMTILVINTVVHFYTVCHLTALTAIKQLDPEFEAVSASLKVPIVRTFVRVTVPICLPTILDIFVYMFVNAMTTVSAVIFLYGAESKVASISVVHMDEAGQTSAAAAMAMLILVTSAGVKLLHVAASSTIERLTQAWRRR